MAAINENLDMMDDAQKETLIEQFRAYLEDVQRGVEPAPEFPAGEEQFAVTAELAALKNEVKLESRQVREALDQFKAVFDTLQAGYEALTRERQQRQQEEQQRRREALRPLLLQLLELYDRLQAGASLKPPPRRSWLGRWRRRQDETQWLEALREGQAITLRRLKQVLLDYHLKPVAAVGQPFDPYTMRAVEVESRTAVAPGLVTEEHRRGFFWDEELLRPAEVKVNKPDETEETV